MKYLCIPLFLFLSNCSLENKTLLEINGDKYTVADFQERFKFAPNDDSVKKMEKINEYVNQMLVYTEAKEAGYDKDPVVVAAFESSSKDIIWRTYYNDIVVKEVKVKDTEIRDLYDKIIEQYHLAQIVVAEESLANYLGAELKKGASFEELLVYSLDTISENGDIGTFSVISIPEEITRALKKVKDGGVTEPVRFGEYYMIFKVVEHSTADKPTYADVKENIKSNLWQEKVRAKGEEYYNKLIERAKVEYNPAGLEILSKPDSLITEQDLNTWVVKKYDTSYVYVRSVLDAVQYIRSNAQLDPKYLIDQKLIPDLVYDEAMKNYYDKRPVTKRKLNSAYSLLLYQKYYSDKVTQKAIVDSAEVTEHYKTHRDEFKNKELNQVFTIVQAQLRDAKVATLSSNLFDSVHAKYKSLVNEDVVAQLLKEAK